jgi:hypothetical protein
MSATLNINEILSKVKELNKEEQLSLLQQLTLIITKNKTKPSAKTRLSEISGIGSRIWENTDIDRYVEEERQW